MSLPRRLLHRGCRRIIGPLDGEYAFSTKPQDAATQLYYYGHRFYNPETGRWPNRDPIEEQGGVNLYGFVNNDSINAYDPLDLAANWHHLLPNEFQSEFARVGMNINDAKYGWVLDADFHTGKAGLHPDWNNEWKAFFDRYKASGLKPTAVDIESELTKIKSRFSSQLSNGVAAKVSYSGWKSCAKRARREAIERFFLTGGKKVVKKVPLLGLVFIVEDISAKGVGGGIANNLLDQVPWIGWAKFGSECAFGDWIPDK